MDPHQCLRREAVREVDRVAPPQTPSPDRKFLATGEVQFAIIVGESLGAPCGQPVTGLGIVGFIAKGVALAIVGVLLLVAALSTDAEVAGGIDGAVDAMLALALGPLIAGVVGAGFIAYGVFTVARARFARM